MVIREKLNAALKEAMKSKDKLSLSTVRLINAAIKDRDLTARAKGQSGGIDENEILSMLQTMIKQRIESAATYRKGNREELAEQEENEIVVIKSFLPEAIEGAELEALIEKIIADTGAESVRDMGKVMGVLKGEYAGRIDMGAAGGLIKAKLA